MDRFWSKVDKSGECWEWAGAKHAQGYGVFKLNGQTHLTHRVSALMAGIISDISDGAFVCHSCDNTACVNPDHLWRGNHAKNMEDKFKKGRCLKGSEHACAKLTEDDVRCIRNLLLAGATQNLIARQFGVSETTVSDINTGKRWSHV